MTVRMNGYFNIDSLEIAFCVDAVPVVDRLANRLIPVRLLNSIVPHSSRDRFSVFQFVVLVYGHKGAAGYAVRSLQDDWTGPTLSQELLHRVRQPMKVVLRAA